MPSKIKEQPKKMPISFRISTKTYEKFKLASEKNNRSIARQIEAVIEEWLTK